MGGEAAGEKIMGPEEVQRNITVPLEGGGFVTEWHIRGMKMFGFEARE